MTTTTETNQAAREGDLLTILGQMFGAPPEPEQYEYLRIPGLHLAAELDEVIEPDADYVVWQSGRFHDGRMLLTVYCRRRKTPEPAAPPTVEPAAESPSQRPTVDSETASPKTVARKRAR